MITDVRNEFRAPPRFRRRLPAKLAIGTIAMLPFCTLPACAQTMNYGSLEDLFGEPVTTSATGSPQRATEVPVNMIIVTADEIRRSGARDIPGVLRHVAGVDVMQWMRDNTDVSIRGYDQAFAARTLVLIDGRQVYADYYGFVPWSALPVELSAIRQIEIVKGPNAALFGFNAVGGVINIITYNPRYDDVNSATARMGTQGLAELTGVATVKFGTLGSMRLSGGWRSDNEFQTPVPAAMTGLPRTGNNRAAINADAIFNLSDNIELGIEASHTHARLNEVAPAYMTQNSLYETNSLKVQFTADTNAGLLKLAAYTNWIGWRGVANPMLGTFATHNQVSVIQAEDVFNLGTDHTVRLALEYRHNTATTTPIAGGAVFYDVVSASGMWNWRITPAVAFTNAFRFDHLSLGRSGTAPADYPFTNSDWNRSSTEFSFNSGLAWVATPFDTLRLIVSRGVQLPSLVESGMVVIDTPFIQVTGDPALKPTAVTNYEIAWDRRLPTFDARLQISAFHQDTENMVSVGGNFIMTPVSAYATPANIGSSTANGVELSVNGALGDAWRWSISYRGEIVKDHFLPFATGGRDLVDYEHTTPKHLAKAGFGWTRGNWEADAYLGYQSRTLGLRSLGLGTSLAPVGDYASVDGRVAYRLMNWATIAIFGQNLLQSPQQQTSGPGVERQVFATLSVDF